MSAVSRFPYARQTPFFLCGADKRFSYCLYVPESWYDGTDAEHTLVVLVHGSRRSAETYRDRFMDFAARHRCVVLAPLFPLGVAGPVDSPEEDHNYKFVRYGELRYDLLLHAMIDETRDALGRLREKFLLFGFSGGGQFAHRYFYLHPARLAAVSIGAPGAVTLLDESETWWHGVSDLERHFGSRPDLDAMRAVHVQTVIGELDTEEWDLDVPRGSPFWSERRNWAGRNRRERLDALRASLERHGIRVDHAVVPGIGHDGYAVLGPVMQFFERCL